MHRNSYWPKQKTIPVETLAANTALGFLPAISRSYSNGRRAIWFVKSMSNPAPPPKSEFQSVLFRELIVVPAR